MKALTYMLLLSSLILMPVFAYVDDDIDGVDDSVDLCPNTPFDVLVDDKGCDISKKRLGILTLKAGSEISFDKPSQSSTNINFFGNYRYHDWDVTLSNANYTTYDNINGADIDTGDLYLSGGYLFHSHDLYAKVSLGTKFADEANDYFSALNLTYYLTTKQDIFLYYGYTLSGEISGMDVKDFHSVSVGTGRALSERFYSGVSYDYIGASITGAEAAKSLSWFNSYTFSKHFFTTLSYSHGLDDASYDHTISLKLGVRFE